MNLTPRQKVMESYLRSYIHALVKTIDGYSKQFGSIENCKRVLKGLMQTNSDGSDFLFKGGYAYFGNLDDNDRRMFMQIEIVDLLTVLGIYAKQLPQIRMLFDLVTSPEGQQWSQANLEALKNKIRASAWGHQYG